MLICLCPLTLSNWLSLARKALQRLRRPRDALTAAASRATLPAPEAKEPGRTPMKNTHRRVDRNRIRLVSRLPVRHQRHGPHRRRTGRKNFKYGTRRRADHVDRRGDPHAQRNGWRRHDPRLDQGNVIPGFTIQEQELIEQRDKAYNMITIIGPSNTAQSIYFDISTYYRRIGNDNFPKPLS